MSAYTTDLAHHPGVIRQFALPLMTIKMSWTWVCVAIGTRHAMGESLRWPYLHKAHHKSKYAAVTNQSFNSNSSNFDNVYRTRDESD